MERCEVCNGGALAGLDSDELHYYHWWSGTIDGQSSGLIIHFHCSAGLWNQLDLNGDLTSHQLQGAAYLMRRAGWKLRAGDMG